MSKNFIKSVDGLTTAERSLNNSKNINLLKEELDFVGNVLDPTSNTFGDGSSVDTQATKAENIISEEDKRLDGEILKKVSTDLYESEQGAQDFTLGQYGGRLNVIEESLTSASGRLDGIESELDGVQGDITTLSAADILFIAEDVRLEGLIGDEQAKNAQQDVRLDILESELGSVGSTFSVYSGLAVDGFSSLTPVLGKADIVNDFGDKDIAENKFANGEDLQVEVKSKALVRMDFNYTLRQNTGTNVSFTVELYNVTKNVVIDSNVVKYDFSGATEIESNNQFNIGEVAIGDVVAYRIYVDTGLVDIIESKGIMTVTTSGSDVGALYDKDIISTSTVGGLSVLEDINFLNTKRQDLESNKADNDVYSKGVDGEVKIMSLAGAPVIDYDTSVNTMLIGENEDGTLGSSFKLVAGSGKGQITSGTNVQGPSGNMSGTAIMNVSETVGIGVTALDVEVSTPTGSNKKAVVNVEYLEANSGSGGDGGSSLPMYVNRWSNGGSNTFEYQVERSVVEEDGFKIQLIDFGNQTVMIEIPSNSVDEYIQGTYIAFEAVGGSGNSNVQLRLIKNASTINVLITGSDGLSVLSMVSSIPKAGFTPVQGGWS